MIFKIVLLVVVGGLIGWITNILAIKLIFRPLKGIKILNFEIIGLIPKRRKEIAKNISEIVERDLISIDELLEQGFKEEDKEELVSLIKKKIMGVIDEKTKFIPSFVLTMIKAPLEEVIDEELDKTIEEAIDDIKEKGVEKIKERINIGKIVEEKINALDLEELEKIILEISKKELKHIEVLGLVLGALIGLVQGIIITLI
ncbi:MAG: DUF445 domain-containing protein [Clostridium sp.]|uniref:DUF445 domain-containing protein n=1 Tax=Clostridium sp. TaxID=1506 RepID=UPI003F2EE626